jgi:hypothetical protein
MNHTIADAIALVAAMAVVVLIATLIFLESLRRGFIALVYEEPLFVLIYAGVVICWLYIVARLIMTLLLQATLEATVII